MLSQFMEFLDMGFLELGIVSECRICRFYTLESVHPKLMPTFLSYRSLRFPKSSSLGGHKTWLHKIKATELGFRR